MFGAVRAFSDSSIAFSLPSTPFSQVGRVRDASSTRVASWLRVFSQEDSTPSSSRPILAVRMSFAMDWSVSLSVFARVSAGPFRASVGACWDASRPPRPLTACAAPACRIFLCLVFSYGCMLVVDHSLLTRTRVSFPPVQLRKYLSLRRPVPIRRQRQSNRNAGRRRFPLGQARSLILYVMLHHSISSMHKLP